MERQLVAEQLNGNIESLPSYEVQFAEGDTGELRLYLQRPLYQEEIDQLEQQILSQGVLLTEPISQDARVLVIKFRKAIAPLAIIATSVGLITSILIGWQIFKESGSSIPTWIWVICGGIVLVTVASVSKKNRKEIKKCHSSD